MRHAAFGAVTALAVAVLSADTRGIPPRPSRTQYPITCFTERVAIGAALLPAEKVRATFGAEVEKRFVVVEVGVFPKLGKVELKHSDFALRLVAPRTLTRPADPASIDKAASLKLLPETGAAQPVGGYLFFALPEPPGYTAYELDYTGEGAWLTLPLTPKHK